jgi:hypothetical protein
VKARGVPILPPIIECAPKIVPLHKQLGIETYEHQQVTSDYHCGFGVGPHCFRERITLAKVLA